MDIIDIVLAKALSSEGQIDTYAAKAAAAARKAEQAESNAETAIAAVNAAATDIDSKVSAAEDLLATAQDALDAAEAAGVTAEMVESKASKTDTVLETTLSIGRAENSTVGTNSVVFGNNNEASGNYSYAQGNGNVASGEAATAQGIGTIAQTDGMSAAGKFNVETSGQAVVIGNGSSDLNRSNAYALDWNGNGYFNGDIYINCNDDSTGGTKLTSIPSGGTTGQVLGKVSNTSYDIAWINQTGSSSGGGSINFDPKDAKHLIIIGVDGDAEASSVTERAIVEALIKAGVYAVEDSVGIEIDYVNKTTAKTQDALIMQDFSPLAMYGGRKRCNVADDGTITAFYGEAGYADDGSNGQVMVYQPKFYYLRIPIKIENGTVGKIIQKESILLSETSQAGFKIHPLFKNADGEELDYVLLSAYEGSVYDVSAAAYMTDDNSGIDFNSDKLSSISNVKPVSGKNNELTLENAERLAQNRGSQWHITNMEVESANQMLEMIEYGSLNMQASLNYGIVNLPSYGTGVNGASLTGSTASLGNSSGRAVSTTNRTNGSTMTYSDADKCAISYRGVENPWGNIWTLVGGSMVSGNGSTGGGIVYICNNFNYNYSAPDSNYGSVGFSLPSTGGYISCMGYGNEKYDWVIMPAECASTANSAVPVGDSLWVVNGLNRVNYVTVGGTARSQETAGPFYYGCDRAINDSATYSANARLMLKPVKNSTYEANIAKWRALMEV